MSQIIHMDTEQVENAAKQLAQTSQQILQFMQEMRSHANNIPWEGQSRDEFILQFEDLARSISAVAEQGNVLASRVEREVAKWHSCDATLGAAPGQTGGSSFPHQSTGQRLPDGPLPLSPELGEHGQSPFKPIPAGPGGENPFTQLPGEQPEKHPWDLTSLGSREDGQNPFDRTELRAGEGGEGHPITSPTSDRAEAMSLPPLKDMVSFIAEDPVKTPDIVSTPKWNDNLRSFIEESGQQNPQDINSTPNIPDVTP